MDDADSRVGVYSIGAVARMVDVPAQTLRAWEERYSLIIPVRSAGGQRLYSRDHVEELRFLREHIDSGLQPADAHRLLAERRRGTSGATTDQSAQGEAADDGTEERPLMILLAERDPYAAEFAEYFLRTEGYTAEVVLEAERVTERLRTRAPDLLVLDLMISGGAGLELCRTIRRAESLPIVAVSAIASSDEALEAGADAFLQKPVPPLQLVSAVRDLLGTSAYLRRPDRVR
jgi:CheY-like chemotaxis protein